MSTSRQKGPHTQSQRGPKGERKVTNQTKRPLGACTYVTASEGGVVGCEIFCACAHTRHRPPLRKRRVDAAFWRCAHIGWRGIWPPRLAFPAFTDTLHRRQHIFTPVRHYKSSSTAKANYEILFTRACVRGVDNGPSPSGSCSR